MPVAGIGTLEVSKIAGTSLAMTEKLYGHLVHVVTFTAVTGVPIPGDTNKSISYEISVGSYSKNIH